MKTIITIILSIFTLISLNAQRVVEKQIAVNAPTNLTLSLDFADTIQIKPSKDNSVRIKATVNINDNLHNDKYELFADEGSQSLRISAKIHDMKSLRVPCKNYIGTSYDCQGGKCLTMNINYEIEVPVLADIKVETISGDIIIEKSSCPMWLKSISGFIDLSIPSSTNSDIKIETITGGVYTDHELKKENVDCDSNPGGTDAYIRLGSGGNRIKLITVSGDIYVRKM